jgi:hypothetical protein
MISVSVVSSSQFSSSEPSSSSGLIIFE